MLGMSSPFPTNTGKNVKIKGVGKKISAQLVDLHNFSSWRPFDQSKLIFYLEFATQPNPGTSL